MDSTQLFTFFFASIVIILSPGPDLIYALNIGIKENKKAIILTCLGFALGNIFHLLLFLLGIGVVLKSNSHLTSSVQILGGSYLVILGIQSILASRKKINFHKEQSRSFSAHYFFKAMTMNILNPKVIIFFMAFFPQFIKEGQVDKLTQLIILGLIFVILVFVLFLLLSLSISKVGILILEKSKIKKYFDLSIGLLFIGIGIKIFIN